MENGATKWIKHYSSDQKILLVGEGDFSFAACLATSFGDASNIVATSLDSKAELWSKYSEAIANLEKLESLGCLVIHQVNAHTMSHHPLLRYKLFDRIIFNFPHATLLYKEHDPLQIWYHQELVRGFMKSARYLMARGGEVHVTHKTNHPYSDWEIPILALNVGLQLVKAPRFSLSDYPGYLNKRAYAPHFGGTFSVGASRTFIFQTLQWPDEKQLTSQACPCHLCFGHHHSRDTHVVSRPSLNWRPLHFAEEVLRPVIHHRPHLTQGNPYLLHPPPPTRPQWPMDPRPNHQQFWHISPYFNGASSTTSSSQLLKDFSLEFYDMNDLQFMDNWSLASLHDGDETALLFLDKYDRLFLPKAPM